MDRHAQNFSRGGSWLRDNGWGDSRQTDQSRSFGWDNEPPPPRKSFWDATDEEEEEQRRRSQQIREPGYDDAGAMDDDPSTVTCLTAGAASSASEASTALGLAGGGWADAVAAITQRNAKDKSHGLGPSTPSATHKPNAAFKSLLVGNARHAGGEAASAATPAHPVAAAASPAPPAFKPIRFVRSRDQTLAEKTMQGDCATEETVHKQSNRVGLAKPNLLSRAAPASKPSSAAPSLRAAPSLLAPFKPPKPASSSLFQPLAPGLGTSATAPSGGSGGSGFVLAHIFHVSYRHAQRKKQSHREGYLHLFRSSVTTDASAAAASSAAAAAHSTALIKSHLYSERGHLIDEQLGSSSIMQYDERITKPQHKNRNPFGGEGIGSRQKRRRRGDEVSDSDESDEEEDGGFGSGGGEGSSGSRLAEFNAAEASSSSISGASASPASSSSSLLFNVFAESETVYLGEFECNLEEEITLQEYEKKKKIMSELRHAKIGRSEQ